VHLKSFQSPSPGQGAEVPHPIQGNDGGQAFFGVLNGRLTGTDGTEMPPDEVAGIALAVIAIIKAHHIVDVWSNEVAQNNMRNAIDDYFFEVLRDRKGVELTVDLLDELEQRLMDLARARFPD
jgi:type I restriction enzyme R subunit